MAASSYYDAPGATATMSHFQSANTHLEGTGQSQVLGQEIHSQQRQYPSQGIHPQQNSEGRERIGNSNYAQGALQQTNAGTGEAAQADDRGMATKCNEIPSRLRTRNCERFPLYPRVRAKLP